MNAVAASQTDGCLVSFIFLSSPAPNTEEKRKSLMLIYFVYEHGHHSTCLMKWLLVWSLCESPSSFCCLSTQINICTHAYDTLTYTHSCPPDGSSTSLSSTSLFCRREMKHLFFLISFAGDPSVV